MGAVPVKSTQLPVTLPEAKRAVRRALDGNIPTRKITLAEAQMNDGQRMLAFNDFFIGKAGHSSARYTVRVGREMETQSSSGIIVSTGVGCSGWMSSVMNMARGVARRCGAALTVDSDPGWDDPRLMWAVREPFASRHSSADMVLGTIEHRDEMVIESLMPQDGRIFSDGVESDFIEFNSGSIARIKVAARQASLAVPGFGNR